MSMLLGIMTLAFLVMLLLVKFLTGFELRAKGQSHRNNQNRMLEIESELEVSRKKYLNALKAEGVAKHKVSQVRIKLTGLKQHFDQIQMTASQQRAQKEKDKGGKLEALVLEALGGTSVRKDTHFKRVMKVINQLIDVDKQTNSEELFTAIQKKIAEMGATGTIGDAGDSEVADQAPEPDAQAEVDGIEETRQAPAAEEKEPVEARVAADDPETHKPQAPKVGMTRRQLVEDAVKKK